MSGKLIDDKLYATFEDIVEYGTTLVIACLGLVTNTLNVIVFARQGYKDGVNVSMTCIALWDFLKCLADFVDRMYKPIGLASPVMARSYRNTVNVYFAYTHDFSSYVSCALASYVSIERCLCVCIPFTVKSVFTPKFTLFMVTAISVIVFGAYIVIYFLWDLVHVYSPIYNTTIPNQVHNEFYHTHGEAIMVYYNVVAFLVPSGSILILCVCSVVTVYFLRKSSDSLRKTGDSNIASKDKSSTGVSQREKQVVKMLLVVILVYIVNLFPRIVFYIASLIEPEFALRRFYNNVFVTSAMFMFVLDDVNAAANFFIFVTMSSNFRATFLAIFPSAGKWL